MPRSVAYQQGLHGLQSPHRTVCVHYEPLKPQSQQKSYAFFVCLNVLDASFPIGAVRSGSTLFASVLELVKKADGIFRLLFLLAF